MSSLRGNAMATSFEAAFISASLGQKDPCRR
jgi:hypothetical protein